MDNDTVVDTVTEQRAQKTVRAITGIAGQCVRLDLAVRGSRTIKVRSWRLIPCSKLENKLTLMGLEAKVGSQVSQNQVIS